MRIYIKVHGFQSFEVMQAYNEIAVVFQETKCHFEALKSFKMVDLLDLKVMGKHHWIRASVEKHISRTEQDIGRNNINIESVF